MKKYYLVNVIREKYYYIDKENLFDSIIDLISKDSFIFERPIDELSIVYGEIREVNCRNIVHVEKIIDDNEWKPRARKLAPLK